MTNYSIGNCYYAKIIEGPDGKKTYGEIKRLPGAVTTEIEMEEPARKKRRWKIMDKIRYYARMIKWLWDNRTWANTRQKYKALDKYMENFRR